MANQILDFLQKQIGPELQEKLAKNLNVTRDALKSGINNLADTLIDQVQNNPNIKNILDTLDKNSDGNIADDIQRMIDETGTNIPENMKNIGAQIASHLTPEELEKLAASMNIDVAKVEEVIHNLGPVIMQRLQDMRSNPGTSDLMAFVDKNVDKNTIDNVVNKIDDIGKSLFKKPDNTKDQGKDI